MAPICPLTWGTIAVLTAASASAGLLGGGRSTTWGGPASPFTSRANRPTRRRPLTRGRHHPVDAPAQSTEEEYFQACHAAKTWMQNVPGDPQTHFERYLAAVQLPHVVGPGTWNIAWAALPLPRQAGVIVAAEPLPTTNAAEGSPGHRNSDHD